MAVRLKDIADDLGVSKVTVSKVLRGNPDIGERTRALVLQRMKELNYQPNMLARGLASGKTYAVGLIVPDLVHPFFGELAKSLSGALRSSNRALVISSSEEDAVIEQQEIRTLLSRGVDVLLIASCQPHPVDSKAFSDGRTPFLLVDRNFPLLNANFVGSDDVKVGELATQHLIALGRKRIAHIGGQGMSPAIDRLTGYRNALAAAGLIVPDNFVITRERFEETADSMGHLAMRELLSHKTRPDAVFCYNDLSAIGAMAAAMEAGLRIPEDIAFVGCGGLRYADYLKVPLTTVDHATQRMGEIAARLALDLTEKRARPPQSILVEPTLVVRQSTVAL